MNSINLLKINQMKGPSFLIKLLISVLFTCQATTALAADKALIIGVQEYRNPDANLVGIDIDVNQFKQAVLRLGVAPDNILILMNERATEPNIKQAFKHFLGDVKASDRVYVYFSGHGSRIRDMDGDESDGVDEFLVTYEFDHRKPIDGALLDDEVHELLTGVPSQNVVAVVDACHSGTISRGLEWVELGTRSLGETRAVKKFWSYPGMPEHSTAMSREAFPAVQSKQETNLNYVTISAAQDDEAAIATSKGSLFTTGVSLALQYALEKDISVSPNFLFEGSKNYVHSVTKAGSNRFTPAISGNQRLFTADLKARPTSSMGSEWQAAEQLVPNPANLPLSIDKTQYRVNEEIALSIDIPINGYLYLLSVDKYDNTTLLFPNNLNSDNRVQRGQRFVPGERSIGFALYGAEPVGESLLVALVREQPFQARDMSVHGRDASGQFVDALVALDEHIVRAIKVGTINGSTANQNTSQSSNQNNSPVRMYANKAVINVVQYR